MKGHQIRLSFFFRVAQDALHGSMLTFVVSSVVVAVKCVSQVDVVRVSVRHVSRVELEESGRSVKVDRLRRYAIVLVAASKLGQLVPVLVGLLILAARRVELSVESVLNKRK